MCPLCVPKLPDWHYCDYEYDVCPLCKVYCCNMVATQQPPPRPIASHHNNLASTVLRPLPDHLFLHFINLSTTLRPPNSLNYRKVTARS